MNVGCGSEKPKQVWFFAYLSEHLPIMITFTDGSTTRYTYDPTRLNRVSSKETKPLTIAEQFKVISNYLKLNLNFLQHE